MSSILYTYFYQIVDLFYVKIIMGLKGEQKMADKNPLLSDFIEELKDQNNGSNLNKHIAIFYNDWSLNPYDDDDYSERVQIKGDVLKNINSKEFQNYKVLWYDPYIFNPNFIEICVECTSKTITLTDSELKELGGLLNSRISECLDDSLVNPFEEEKQKAKGQINKYKRLYNKIIKRIYKVEGDE